jgi:hypothetical protein
MFVTANLVITIAGAAGWIGLSNDFLWFIPAGPPKNLVVELLGIGPVALLVYRYQQHSRRPLRWWETPAYAAAFAVYVYLWTFATLWAWARMLLGRSGWAKTPRAQVEAARP